MTPETVLCKNAAFLLWSSAAFCLCATPLKISQMKKRLLFILMLLPLHPVFAQNALKDVQLRWNFNDTGTRYAQLTLTGQTWVRYTDMNRGSTIFDAAQQHAFDIGVRRWRMSLFAQPTERIFIYTQFGMNNFSSSSKQFQGFFIHDAWAEYAVHPKGLSIGAGLSAWNGLSRYASPSIGSILTLDAPLYQQVTGGVNDQFLRKLSVHFKGKLAKLDYRLMVTKPLAVQNAVSTVGALREQSDFSARPSTVQLQGYLMWQFFDQESNRTPFNAGTYLGSKNILNVGSGFIIQPKAMWHLNGVGDTVSTDMLLFSADVFYDAPLNPERGDAITFYAAYHYMDLGPKYLRNVGVMNPANGTDATGTLTGGGNAFPMIGTGSTLYAQVGYKLKDGIIGKATTFQPFAASQLGLFDALDAPMIMAEAGFNVLLTGTHHSKLSLAYQSRPVFKENAAGRTFELQRKGMVVLQYQVSI